jgi:Flp pilus assembly protein TadD
MTPKRLLLDPGTPGRAHLAEAYELYNADKFDAALTACDAALICLPMLAEAHNLRGILLEELGREAEAIVAYQKALELEPNFIEPRENLLQIEAEQGGLAEAYRQWEGHNIAAGLTACDNALQKIPFSAEAHNLRGILLEELGHPVAALQAYRTAVRLDPTLADAKENLQELCDEWDARFHLTTIVSSNYPVNLHILKGRLEAEGIPAFIADEEVITLYWLYATALGGAKLQVWRQDAERAAGILGLGWPVRKQSGEQDEDGEATAKDLGQGQESGERQEAADEECTEIELDTPLTLEELSTLSQECAPDAVAGKVDATQDDDPAQCPACGSVNISYRRFHERLFFLTWLLLRFPVPFLKRRWRCLECGREWRPHR